MYWACFSYWTSTWSTSAICCSHWTLQHRKSEVGVGWLFQWGEPFDKNKLQAVVVSSSESLLGFHEHSWMFLGLPVQDCCDMGTGDETGLLQHTNTALHSRPCVQLVGMTQEAQGFIESCWSCCASRPSALAKLSLQGNGGQRADGTQAAWPMLRVSVGRCVLCECREMRPGQLSAPLSWNSMNSMLQQIKGAPPSFSCCQGYSLLRCHWYSICLCSYHAIYPHIS